MIFRNILFTLIFSVSLFAGAGNFDSTFGEASAVAHLGHKIYITKSAIQSDNKIIVAFTDVLDPDNTDLGLIRFNANGTVDNGFATQGKVIKDINNTDNHVVDLKLLDSGKILLLGASYNDFYLLRFNQDGSLDTDFGSNGIVYEYETSIYTNKLMVQSNGKIIVLGSNRDNKDITIFRYNSSGLRDNTFDTDGKVSTLPSDYVFGCYSVDSNFMITSDIDNKTVIAITCDNRASYAYVRYDTNGSLDNSFGYKGFIQGNDRVDKIVGIDAQTNGKVELFVDKDSYTGFYRYKYDVNGTLEQYNTIRTPQGRTLHVSDMKRISTNKYLIVGSNSIDNITVGHLNSSAVWDTSFGVKGVSSTSFDPKFTSVTDDIDSNGRTVCVGYDNFSSTDIVLIRYLQNGQRDRTFKTQRGSVISQDYSYYNYQNFNAVAEQNDGKIVVAGTGSRDYGEYGIGNIVVQRYDSQGYCDTSFGEGGRVFIEHSSSHEEGANTVAIENDGKILVGGSYKDGSGNNYHKFLLLRLDANGTLDTDFANNGKAILAFSKDAIIKDMILLSDGKIIVVGQGTDNSYSDFVLVRYNYNGSIDTNFGDSGKIVTDVGGNVDGIYRAQMQNDGKILVAGFSANPNNSYYNDFILARYSQEGVLDMSFATGGVARTSLGGKGDKAYDLALQSDGKILIAGESLDNSSKRRIAIVRYDSNGTIDESFGHFGVVIDDSNPTYSGARNVEVDSNGKILICGYGYNSATTVFRYNSDGTKDNSFISDNQGSYNDMILDSSGKIITVGSKGTTKGFAMQRYEDGEGTNSTNRFSPSIINYLLN